jgi:AcrR family transcriptional regulator
MARPGVASRPGRSRASATATRDALVEAAIETLKRDGFAGASARAIAARAGCNQALVFYHFGSVVELLLAALDEVAARRLARSRAALAAVTDATGLLAVAADVFREDMERGDVTVLVEMIAGASATPGLGEQVAARIAPWRDFAADAIAAGLGATPVASVVVLDDVAHAVVALYLGLELLAHLDQDRARGAALFDHARPLASLVDALTGTAPGSHGVGEDGADVGDDEEGT